MYFPDEAPSRRNSHTDQLRELKRKVRKYKLLFAVEVVLIVVCVIVAIVVFS